MADSKIQKTLSGMMFDAQRMLNDAEKLYHEADKAKATGMALKAWAEAAQDAIAEGRKLETPAT